MEYRNNPAELTFLAKALMLTNGGAAEAMAMVGSHPAAPDNVRKVLQKAAVNPGALSDPTSAGALAPMRAMADNVLAAGRNRSVVLRARADGAFARWPLRTSGSVVSTAITGDSVSEQGMKPLHRLTLTSAELQPKKVTTQVAVTRELLKFGGPADAVITNELVGGTATGVDARFFADVQNVSGLQTIDSSGSTAGEQMALLRQGLRLMNITAASRIYWAVTPDTMAELALDEAVLAGAGDLTLAGGVIGGVTVLPSDAQTPGDSTLFDASRIVADFDVITLRTTSQGDMQFSDDPSDAEHQLVSLWQTNMTGFLAELWAGWSFTSSDSVVQITGASA